MKMLLPPSGEVRILIVDDHPIVREGLARMLDREKDLVVCGDAEDINTALTAMGRLHPDMLIVDVTLAAGSGIDLVKCVRRSHPRMPVLVLSMHDGMYYAEQALRAGANGYITKMEAPKTLVTAIRKVLSGDIYLSEKTAAAIIKRSVSGTTSKDEQDFLCLSDREREVFRLLGSGMGTRHIAERLGVSIRTIDTYREKIKHKLNLRNASELLQHAIQWAKNIDQEREAGKL
ncbi:response regulator transcription factor [Geobacter sp. FeAm09]|uniref:response regulator n=1 Tax=Geobacter sp. FeAm09 TaxID=2597769 RepID=UPI00197AD095|nr:response regulator transcription factor [Geobacter sp. FeAm09]